MPLRRYDRHVYSWGRYQPERGYEFNGFALTTTEGPDAGHVIVTDPIAPTDDELAAIRRLGSHFTVVLLNAHHERDAARVATALAAPVLIHEGDRAEVKLPCTPVSHGHALPGGWTLHHLMDLKTPGESVLLHAGLRTCVAGDAVIGDPVTGLRLVPAAKLLHRGAALASLAQLAALDFDALYLADGFSLPAGGREALRRFLDRERATA